MKIKKVSSKKITKEERELIDILFKKVTEVTGYDKKTIVSKKRNSNLVMTRMIIASILRNEAHLTFHNIGLSLIKDHSSILYYTKQHKENLVYPPYNRMYFDILDRVIHKIKRTDVEALDVEITRVKSKLDNLKHKRKLLIWSARRYGSSEV